jgi:hypothetical protein
MTVMCTLKKYFDPNNIMNPDELLGWIEKGRHNGNPEKKRGRNDIID